jgi:hypothetical protein
MDFREQDSDGRGVVAKRIWYGLTYFWIFAWLAVFVAWEFAETKTVFISIFWTAFGSVVVVSVWQTRIAIDATKSRVRLSASDYLLLVLNYAVFVLSIRIGISLNEIFKLADDINETLHGLQP